MKQDTTPNKWRLFQKKRSGKTPDLFLSLSVILLFPSSGLDVTVVLDPVCFRESELQVDRQKADGKDEQRGDEEVEKYACSATVEEVVKNTTHQ